MFRMNPIHAYTTTGENHAANAKGTALPGGR